MRQSVLTYKVAMLRVLLISMLAVLIVLGLATEVRAQSEDPAAKRGPASGPSLRIDAPKHVEVGEPITVTLAVKGATDIAGYETNLLFDPRAAEFDGLSQRKNDLRKFGRDVGPLGGVETPQGVSIGAYSCPVDNCLAAGGGTRANRGGRGEVKLAAVSIIPNQPGRLEIKLDATKFVDSTGKLVNVDLGEGRLIVGVGPTSAGSLYSAPGASSQKSTSQASSPRTSDLTGDGRVTHADAMEVAAAWTLLREDDEPCGETDRDQDVNRDGCVDVADLQMVAANYNAELVDSTRRAAPSSTETVRAPAGLLTGALLSLLDWMAPNEALAAESTTFTVNTGADDADANIGDGSCATAGGACTLRAAITEANLHSGPDTIAFNIPGTGVRTIQLASQLPNLNDTTGPTIIDGQTQPGSAPNTDPSVSNARIGVQIVGTGEANFGALWVTSPGNTIRGLSFCKLKMALRIYGSGAHDNVVVGNFIGTDAAGTYSASAKASGATGLMVQQGAKSNRIGGTSAADRNVISGNPVMGITTYDEATNSNVIVNNIIGLDPTGTKRLANLGHGIDVNVKSSYNMIGGNQPGERNVISGNGGEGVEISHNIATVQNKIVGNFIGTDVTGNAAPAYASNRANGVQLEDGVRNTIVADNVIGNSGLQGAYVQGFYTSDNHLYNNWIGVSPNGTAIPNRESGIRIDYHASKTRIGPGNTIANNAEGFRIGNDDVDFHTITRNSIFGNTGLGIDLEPLGYANTNDAGDTDSGPNEQLNFPVLTDATSTEVTGTACGGCTVEVFVADGGADAHGEGKTFAGSATAAGNGAFAVATNGVAGGDYVTATATDTAGNTSEFSLNKAVSGVSPPSDTTKPTINLTTPPDGATYATNEDVKAAYTCADEEGGSGLKSCDGTVVDGASIDTGSTGEKSFTVTTQDNAGNTASVTHDYTVSDQKTALAAPSDLAAVSASPSKIDLTWADNSTDEAAYTVERSPNGSTEWTVLTSMLAADTTSYRDTSLTAETKYYYRVKATSANGDSDYSNTASATTPSRTVLTEAWTAANGAPWDASRWTTDGGTSGKLDIQSNQGRLRFENLSNARARAIATMPRYADTEVLVSFRFPSTAPRGYLQIFSRASGGWTASGYPDAAYYVEVANDSHYVGLRKVSAGSVTGLSNRAIGQVTTTKQWMRLRVQGSSLKVKVWADGTAEPTAWETEINDTSLSASGVLQMRWIRSSAATDAREVYLDDLKVTNLD